MDPIWYANKVNANTSSLETTHFNNTNVTINVKVPQNLPSLDALEFWPWQVILICLYTATAIVSLGSNLVTIVVLLKGDRISSELWKFLINLSVSDITMSIFSIPFTYTGFMLGRWIFTPDLCPVVNFAQLCSVFVSVWTLTIIGIDRYFAIVHPLSSAESILQWLRSRKMLIIIIVWCCAIGAGSAQLFQTRAVPFNYGKNVYYDCRELWDASSGRVYTIMIFAVTFAAPVTILIFVYSTIAYHILKHVIPGNPDYNRDASQVNRKIKVIKMLATIVGLFAICWAPIHLFTMLVWFYPKFLKVKTKLEYVLFVGSYFVCHWLSMAHSFVNPIVYCFMSENFRQNLRSIISGCFLRFKVCREDEDFEFETQGQSLTSYHNSKGRKPLVSQRVNADV